MHKVYISGSCNPYFNLAFEEYLVRNHQPSDQILFLWQNQKTVVIGRNQNPWKECDLEALKSHGGRLVRRLSGGGAVYHDNGNLNFTFVSALSDKKIQENIELLIRVLARSGITAEFSGKNDVLVQGCKISGNAFFVEGETLCHHGTILMDVDLETLSGILTVSEKKLQSKGIDSVRSRVKNLKELNQDITIESLKNDFVEEFLTGGHGFRIFPISDELTADSNIRLKDVRDMMGRYESWEWNFGSTPEFNLQIQERFPWGSVEMYLLVQDGIITNAKIDTDALDVSLPDKINRLICNRHYDHDQLIELITNSQF